MIKYLHQKYLHRNHEPNSSGSPVMPQVTIADHVQSFDYNGQSLHNTIVMVILIMQNPTMVRVQLGGYLCRLWVQVVAFIIRNVICHMYKSGSAYVNR